jgi:hypothetical protein
MFDITQISTAPLGCILGLVITHLLLIVFDKMNNVVEGKKYLDIDIKYLKKLNSLIWTAATIVLFFLNPVERSTPQNSMKSETPEHVVIDRADVQAIIKRRDNRILDELKTTTDESEEEYRKFLEEVKKQ